jgi:phage terminase large subunit-like protein
VVEVVRQVRDAGLLPAQHAVGLDPAGIGAVLDALAEIGVDGEQVAGVSQGWRLNGAIKTTERRLAEGEMRHAGQPLMAWSVGNAKAEPRGNAVSITKQAAGSAKIDPLIALFCAVELMARNPNAGHVIQQGFVAL